MHRKKLSQEIKSSQSKTSPVKMDLTKIVVHFHSNEEIVEYLVESGAIEYDQIVETVEKVKKILG